MGKKNRRRLSILVNAQTAWHLEEIRKMCGYSDIGQVIDKMMREKLVALRESTRTPGGKHGRNKDMQ